LKSSREFLEDIVAEARFLIDQSLGLSLEDFLADEVKKRAFARSLEIIGEAVKGLSNDLVLRHWGHAIDYGTIRDAPENVSRGASSGLK
jgi:uncharacterized protein with HEPN domain